MPIFTEWLTGFLYTCRRGPGAILELCPCQGLERVLIEACPAEAPSYTECHITDSNVKSAYEQTEGDVQAGHRKGYVLHMRNSLELPSLQPSWIHKRCIPPFPHVRRLVIAIGSLKGLSRISEEAWSTHSKSNTTMRSKKSIFMTKDVTRCCFPRKAYIMGPYHSWVSLALSIGGDNAIVYWSVIN